MTTDSGGGVIGLLSVDGHVSERLALRTLMSLRGLPARDEKIRGLLVRVRSGGGALGAAQAIQEGLNFVSDELSIPIVGVVVETALSAGFYVARSCDVLVATPAATVAGAGAIVRRPSLEALLERIGIGYEAVASSPLKDVLGAWAPLSEEQRALLQGLVADTSRQFAEGLRVGAAAVRAQEALIAGTILTGEQAKEIGLVDELGGFFAALTICAQRAQLGDPRLVVLDPEQQGQPVPSLAQLLDGAKGLIENL